MRACPRLATGAAGVARPAVERRLRAEEERQQVVDEGPLAGSAWAVDEERPVQAPAPGGLEEDAPGDRLAQAQEARFGLGDGHRLSIGKRPVSGG
jgi:hypothetical protein